MHQLAGRWYPLPPMWLEGRAWIEYASLLRDPIFAGLGVASGESRPVMLIPGLLAGDSSLTVMRGWLKRVGYRPLRSGIDLNIQASRVLVDRILARLRAEVERGGRKVTLVGQSRGGSLAFGAAQRQPELVEQVITLGTPLGSPLDIHPSVMATVYAVRMVHTVIHGPRNIDRQFERDVAGPPKVPVTAIYSRTDGIVHWEACLRPDVTNIEVPGSHVGMGVNPAVYRHLARLLATS